MTKEAIFRRKFCLAPKTLAGRQLRFVFCTHFLDVATVVLVLFTFAPFFLWAPPEDWFRRQGLVLQLIGIVTVVYDLWSRPEPKDRMWPLQWLLKWARGWTEGWPRKPPETSGILSGNAALQGVQAAGHIGTIGANLTIDQRVAELERRLAEVSASADRAHQAIIDERQAREQALQREASERQQADSKVSNRVEDIAVGTLPVSLFGVFWLALGVIMSTIPQELACWFR